MRTFCCYLAMLVGSACNFAPHYSRPSPVMPEAFRLSAEEEDKHQSALWWEALGDEQLTALVSEAVANNKDMQVAMWRVLEYLANYKVARSALFPQVSGQGAALKQKLPVNENFLPSNIGPITPEYGLDLSLSYEIDFWGKVRNQSSAAYLQYMAQVENRKVVLLTLVGSVVQSYVVLRQLDLQLVIAQNILNARKESLEIARDRFEGGLTSEIEVAQALSVYEEAVAVVADLEKRVPQQENGLSVLLGRSPGSISRGGTLSELKLPQGVPLGKPEDLLVRRPDVVRAEKQLEAAYANIGVARAAFFPQMSFLSLYGVESLSWKRLFASASTNWTVGGGLLQQVFTGGALMGGLRIAEARKQELLFSYQQTVLQALREVNDALIGLQQTKAVFAADYREVEALREYLQLAWYRYYEGQTQYLTVLDAQRRVLEAELHMVEDQARQYLALVDLYKSLGGGWVEDVDATLLLQKR